ncbi:MAG: HAMP domain-containing sensor histidine kinase [Pirellulales bacterium]
MTDLLPNADLEPVSDTRLEGPRVLASLPIRLVPGALPNADDASWSPLRWSLLFTWSSLGVAVLAAALLAHGTIALSERRAAFVSAVTHELRTPLTTFRMYSEMLSEDMVPDEETRRNYARTLHHEADRLSHMVENVLGYARLERGGDGGRRSTMTLEELANVALDCALGRATQAEFEPCVEVPGEIAGQSLHIDAGAVEQIVFNLVDNAAKYAATAEDRRLHIEFSDRGANLVLRVGDHGPGISAVDRANLFQPFRKSAARAAVSAPGVGLGLSLCRRMARAMGGELRRIDRPEGAWFELELPKTG